MAENTGKVYTEIILKLDKLEQSVKKAEQVFKELETKVSSSSGTITSTSKIWAIGYAYIANRAVQMSRTVIGAFKNMVDTYANFEQALVNTQSVAQATTEDFNKMKEAALNVGLTTTTSATDAAKAMYYLASAGFTAKESIAALNGVNELAIATQTDLSKATETVATVLRQYSLQTSKSTDIANIFTAAISNSLATMPKLATSFQYVGTIAAGLGMSVEETTAALEVLYNKGFSGSKAGRGLRNILVNLADSTSVVNKKLQKLGITFDEVNPATNSLAKIMDTLRKNGVDASNAASIFGKVAGAQLQALIAQASTATGGIVDMQKAITGTNRAEQVMQEQMDTLKGSMKHFDNAVKAVSISTGSNLKTALRGVIDTGTDLLKLVNKLPKGVLGLGSALFTIGTASSAAAIALKAALSVLEKLGIISSTVVLPSLGAIGLAIAGVVSVFAAFGFAIKHTKDMNHKLFDSIAKDAGITGKALKDFYIKAHGISDSLTWVSKSSVNDVGGLRRELEKLAKAYNLNLREVLAIAETKKSFVKKAGISIKLLQSELDLQKELGEQQKNNNKAADDHFTKSLVQTDILLKKEKELIAKQQKQATATAYNSLVEAFKEATQYQKVLGKEFDRNSFLASAFKQSLTLLIQKGLDAQGPAIIGLIKLYDKLQKKDGEVGKSSNNWTEKRIAAQESLKKQFAEIDAKQQLAIKTGQKYDAATAKSAAVIGVLNDMVKEHFTVTGAGMQKIFAQYGKYIIVTNTLEKEYIKKLNTMNEKLKEVGKTELEIAEMQRKQALAQAKGNQGAIDAINKYYDKYEEVLKAKEQMAEKDADKDKKDKQRKQDEREALDLARQLADARKKADDEGNKNIMKQLAMYDEYEAKLKSMNETEVEGLEDQRKAAIKAADGFKPLIDLINKYYDALEKKTAFKTFVDNLQKAVSEVDKSIDALNTIQQNSIKAQIAAQNDALQATLDRYAAEEQIEEESAHVAEKTERQKLVAAIDTAQAALDANNSTENQITLKKAQDALTRYDIQQKYLDKEHKAKVDSANKIAELNYKADKVAWEASLMKAYADAALAVLNVMTKTLNPFAIAAAVVAAGVEVAAVSSAKPKPPEKIKYADGGIVPGSSYKGDTTPILANAGELILNKAQQKNIVNNIYNNEQPIQITVQTLLDGKIIAISSAQYYRNGQVKL